MSIPGKQMYQIRPNWAWNLYMHPKVYYKNFVQSCCVTSFSRRCRANLSFFCFTMVKLQLVEEPCQPNLSSHTELKLKTSICIPKLIRKTHFEVNVWYRFPVIVCLICYVMVCKGQFSINCVPMLAKLFKSHEVETKDL